MSIESTIADALVSVLQAVPGINSVNFDKVILATSDFRDFELPAIQLWDVGQFIEHQRGRILVTWSISLEIVMKSLVSGQVSQKDLWELRRTIQLALWANPNLSIPGVVHLVYTGNITDLHSVEPYYIARLDFDVLYYDDLTGWC
jgi:hypothetical protein